MKTKLEIINETVAYYSEDPRGRRAVDNNGGCHYVTFIGQKCAVGRCLIDPDSAPNSSNASALGDLDSLLQPEYRGHDSSFWDDLQDFHDMDRNWTGTGLSITGELTLKKLKEWYSCEQN